jgi:hypothetical protein
VQSERELAKLALQIRDQVRGVRSEMRTARRKRAVATSGAVVGSSGPFSSPCMGLPWQRQSPRSAPAAGCWGMLHTAAEQNLRAVREDKWYYVWALAPKSDIDVI